MAKSQLPLHHTELAEILQLIAARVAVLRSDLVPCREWFEAYFRVPSMIEDHHWRFYRIVEKAYKTKRVNEHKVRDITLGHDLHALSKFFRYAIKQRWTRENPICNVVIPSDADAERTHIVTTQEEKQYFVRAEKNSDLFDLARLMLNQGMRPDELASLQKVDVDLERGRLFIRNGKSPAARRTLDLTTESRQILARRMNGKSCSCWVFPSSRKPGAHITRLNGAHDLLCKKACRSWGLAKFYSLRLPPHIRNVDG